MGTKVLNELFLKVQTFCKNLRYIADKADVNTIVATIYQKIKAIMYL